MQYSLRHLEIPVDLGHCHHSGAHPTQGEADEPSKKIRVAVNGYDVIGKRVADAVVRQDDMELAGVADISADWRPRMAMQKGFLLYGATEDHAEAMRNASLDVSGKLDDLLEASDLVVDCTPKRIAAVNVDIYRQVGIKFIIQGGEKHEVTGHSFVAEASLLIFTRN